MTLSPWIIYLWGIADSVKTASIVLFFFPAIICFICVLVCIFCEVEDVQASAWRALKRVSPMAFITGLLAAFVPSSKIIAVMVVAPAIVNSEPIQKDLPELYKAAKDALMHTLTDK